MRRNPWPLAVAGLWAVTLQGVHAEPQSTKTAPKAVSVPVPVPVPVPSTLDALHGVRALQRPTADWRTYLAAIPELQRYAASFTPFDARATDEALTRGKRSRANVKAWQFVDGPFEWTLKGQLLWIVSGKTEHGALLSVLAPSSGGPAHRASTLIAESDAPLAVGLSTERPNELLWTTCYGCPGQSGSIELTADGRPMFVYR